MRHAPVTAKVGVYGNDNPEADCSSAPPFHWLWEHLPRENVTVLSSPLQRARQTAAAVARQAPETCNASERRMVSQLNEPRTESAFKEFGYGGWQGMTWQEISASEPEKAHAYFAANPWVAPPNSEPYLTFAARVGERVAAISFGAQAHNHNFIVFSHAGTIVAALMQAMGVGGAPVSTALGFQISNCSLTVMTLTFSEQGLLGRVQGVNLQGTAPVPLQRKESTSAET